MRWRSAAGSTPPQGPPRFSIVSAVYDVAPYLEDFIASIEAQDYPLDRVEIVLVDDGSTDASPALLAAWAARRPGLVTVLTKPNGGQGSARNLGLQHVRGEWVTMPDPDDTLAPDYLSRVDAFLTAHPMTELVATRRIVTYDATGKREPHVLDRQFRDGDRLLDLREHPGHFHGSAPAAFFRREALQRENLRFDERIRTNFEDGHFCATYLLQAAVPLVGFVRSAEYHYRKRADRSSTLNRAGTDPRRFTDVPRHGYLDVLRRAADGPGGIPAWLQNLVLYELNWYYVDDENPGPGGSAVHGAVADRFHHTMAEIVTLLDPDVVRLFDARRMAPLVRDTLLHGYAADPWHAPFAVVDKVDLQQGAVRITYRFTGAVPAETFLVDGEVTAPLHAKTRAPLLLDRALVRERIVWLPYGAVAVTLAGHPVEVRTEQPAGNPWVLEGRQARDRVDPRWLDRTTERRVGPRGRLVLRAARSRPMRLLFRRAWVLIDRVQDADDSAEHLFRHVRAHHRRRVNAWFVIESGTPAHHRLRRTLPVRDRVRVVAYGSLRWTLLMLNAEHLISSHADRPITNPRVVSRLARPTWRFVFLQHGVTKDDLSSWLNAKDADLFVVSTPAEYAAVAGDDTAYRYTTREVALTGLPRFDLLRRTAADFPPDRRDLVLVAPTWRSWLATKTAYQTGFTTDAATFRDSDYARQWRALLASPRLAELAERHGSRIALLMHPNLQAVVPSLDLPPHVELHDFDTDPRALFARARVAVTDYSSMAFNAAYIDRPVVYFQFDHEHITHGAHIGRDGYFDYTADGFGPVTHSLDDALAAIAGTLEHGPDPAPQYRQRIDATFPVRDGGCSERVTQAVLAGVRRVQR